MLLMFIVECRPDGATLLDDKKVAPVPASGENTENRYAFSEESTHPASSGESEKDPVEPGNSETSGEEPKTDNSQSPANQDTTNGVDVGNPKDVGPKGEGKYNLYLADAAVDGLSNLTIHISDVFLIDGSDRVFPVNPGNAWPSVDLLSFQNGRKLLLMTGDIPDTGLKGVALRLKSGSPVTGTHAGVSIPVAVTTQQMPSFLSSNIGFDNIVFALLETAVEASPGSPELVMHFPLWKNLKISQGLQISPVISYQLAARQELFDTTARGMIASEVFLTSYNFACAFSSESYPGYIEVDAQNITELNECSGAAGRAEITMGEFTIPWLIEDTYQVVLIGEGLLPLPLDKWINVEGGAITVLPQP